MEKQLKKKILKLVRKFRVKKAKMLNGSVSGQIFQPVENSSGAFLTYLTSHPTRSPLIDVFFSAINRERIGWDVRYVKKAPDEFSTGWKIWPDKEPFNIFAFLTLN